MDFHARRRRSLLVPLSVGWICRDKVILSIVWLLQCRAHIRMETGYADLGPSLPHSSLFGPC